MKKRGHDSPTYKGADMEVMTSISVTRARLRAARERQPAPPPPALPYTHLWLHNAAEGLWTLVVRVRATGQRIPISYRISDAPDVVDAEAVAERLMRFAKGTTR